MHRKFTATTKSHRRLVEHIAHRSRSTHWNLHSTDRSVHVSVVHENVDICRLFGHHYELCAGRQRCSTRRCCGSPVHRTNYSSFSWEMHLDGSGKLKLPGFLLDRPNLGQLVASHKKMVRSPGGCAFAVALPSKQRGVGDSVALEDSGLCCRVELVGGDVDGAQSPRQDSRAIAFSLTNTADEQMLVTYCRLQSVASSAAEVGPGWAGEPRGGVR